MRNFYFTFTTFIALITISCSENTQVAGGDDFPNTLSGLDTLLQQIQGKTTSPPSADINANSDYPIADGFGEPLIDATPWIGVDSSYIFEDTALGKLYWVKTEQALGFTKHDTSTILFDNNIRNFTQDPQQAAQVFNQVSIIQTTLIGPDGATWTRTIEDDDGDLKISGQPNRIKVTQTTQTPQYLETNLMIFEPGPDGDFDTEADNTLFQGSTSLYYKGELIDSSSYQPSEGNQVIYQADQTPTPFEYFNYQSRLGCQTTLRMTAYSTTNQLDKAFPIQSNSTKECPNWTEVSTLDSIDVNKLTGQTQYQETLTQENTLISQNTLSLDYQIKDTITLELTQLENKQHLHPTLDSLSFTLTPSNPSQLDNEVLNGNISGFLYAPENTFEFQGEIQEGQTTGIIRDESSNEYPFPN